MLLLSRFNLEGGRPVLPRSASSRFQTFSDDEGGTRYKNGEDKTILSDQNQNRRSHYK